ncbi:hypothetical protein C8R43DRAFT_958293 [Mycena crocata]|nr:hypothetical protein C8R43DRAFT_958293 [Mycena crocata]
MSGQTRCSCSAPPGAVDWFKKKKVDGHDETVGAVRMPRATRRTGRTESLLKAYIRNNKGRQRRALLWKRAAARIRRDNLVHAASIDINFDRTSDSDSSSDSDTGDSDSSDSWSDILGPDWRSLGDNLLADLSLETDLTSDSRESTNSSAMPELRSMGSLLSDADSESSWSSMEDGMGDDGSGVEGDDEESLSDDSVEQVLRPPFMRHWVQEEIEAMHESNYKQPHNMLPRGPSYLHHVLTADKHGTRLGLKSFDFGAWNILSPVY